MKVKVKFHEQQNFLDFCLTNFGKQYYNIVDICKQLGYDSYMDYYSETRKNVILDVPNDDDIVTYCLGKDTFFASGKPVIYVDLVYNDDLYPKTEIKGSFNQDFNNDFDISRFDIITVGYEGMDLYFYWSITNNGITDQTVTQLVKMDGYPDRLITVLIKSGTTYQFKEVYTNVSHGYKTIHIENQSTNIIFEDSKTIYVRPAVNFISNEDFHYTNTSFTQGDTLNLQWSLRNEGFGTGVYTGVWKVVHNNVTTEFSVSQSIGSNQSYTFVKDYVLTDSGNYSFISTFGDVININVISLAPQIIYNEDLRFNNTSYINNTTRTLSFSYSNTGNVQGSINARIQVSPSDQLVEYFFTAVIQPGETHTFTQDIKLYYGDKIISLTSDVATDSLNINVIEDWNVAKDAFYVSNQWGAPKQWDQPIPTFKTNDSIIVYAYMYQPYPPQPGVKYYINCRYYPDGVNEIYQQFHVAGMEEFEFYTLITTSSTVGLHFIDLISGGSSIGKVYYNIIN